ncbi:hypothetical protein HDU67_008582, partial [Dinochytrium kinnereticum]
MEEGSIKKAIASTLLAKNSTTVWDAAASAGKSGFGGQQHGFFHVVLWEKGHLLPGRKPMLPPTNRPVPIAHSMLSPLNSSSTLYPDGLMTPAWVKRHREEIPSIVVAFFDLHMASQEEKMSQQGNAVEREKDAIMINEINEKRRNAQDRGIKFAVVIVLSVNPTDIPNLEDRVTFIRRGSSLDSKNSLFILPPASYASQSDIQEFVANLQRQLHEHSINYYREHGKRIKKKKSKLPAAPLRPPVMSPLGPAISSMGGASSAKPLNPMGWSIRYDYKMGVFAEFRQELESATRHYEGAYQSLVDMFHASLSGGFFAPGGGGSTSSDVLVPFSARWNEARVLVDSINLRICKLSLYTDAPVQALQQLHKHITNFRGLPEFAGTVTNLMDNFDPPTEGLGFLGSVTGGGSFEYWAWASKQYRIFAELVKIATSKIGLKVPYPPPGSIPNATQNASAATQSLLNTISNTSMNVITGGEVPVATFGPYSATNPYNVVQHAGFYYFIAARCAEERWRKVKDAEKNSSSTLTPLMPTAAAGPGSRQSPYGFPSNPMNPNSSTAASLTAQSLAEQKKIDHGAVIIDLLTKSYEQFKSYRAGRMTLYLASEIARIYETSGKHEMALTFFGRIKRTYRNENWPLIVRSILEISIRCAKSLAQRETVVECLVEMLSEWMTFDHKARAAVLHELMGILKAEEKWAGSIPRPSMLRVPVDMDQIHGFLSCSVQFRKVNGYVGVPAVFQVTIAGDGGVSPPEPLRLSRIRVGFSHRSFDHVWVDDLGVGGGGSVIKRPKFQWLDCSGVGRAKDPDPFAPSSSLSPTTQELEDREVWLTSTDLEITPGCRKVFESVVVPTESQDVKIMMVTLIIETPTGTLYLNYKIGDRKEDTVSRRKWLAADKEAGTARFLMLDGFGEQTSIRVIRRQPNITMSLKHSPPGLIDEVYPISLEIVNDEAEDIYAFADLEFRGSMSGDTLDTSSQISLDASKLLRASGSISPPDTPVTPLVDLETPSGFIKDHNLGKIAPGCTVTLPLFIRATKNVSERVLYATIIYRLGSELERQGGVSSSIVLPSTVITDGTPDLFFRKNETLRISFARAFEATFQTRRCAVSSLPKGLGVIGEEGDDAQKSLVLDHPAQAGLFAERFRGMAMERIERWGLLASVKASGGWAVEVGDVEFVDRKWVGGDIGVVVEETNPSKQLCIGAYRRAPDIQNAITADWVETVVKIPKLTLSKDDIWAFVDIRGPIRKGIPFTLEYYLQNLTLDVSEIS